MIQTNLSSDFSQDFEFEDSGSKDTYKVNDFIIKQRWYHVDISFTGKKDYCASKIFYHNRDIYDLHIKCNESDENAILLVQFPCFVKLNVYARNLNNNEIPYIDYYSDERRDNRFIVLFLSQITNLPGLEKKDEKNHIEFYRHLRLEINYSQQSDTSVMLLGTLCSINRSGLNKRPEYKITVPYGWRLDTRTLDKINKIKEKYEIEINNHNENVGKLRERLKKLYNSNRAPMFSLSYPIGIEYHFIANREQITDIYSPRLEYSFITDKWDLYKKRMNESEKPISTSFKFNLKPKVSMLCAQIFPIIFSVLSVILVLIGIGLNQTICIDKVTPTALLVANLNLGVFSYFTYHKLLSIGYAFKNNRVINVGFLIGFGVTLAGIIWILLQNIYGC